MAYLFHVITTLTLVYTVDCSNVHYSIYSLEKRIEYIIIIMITRILMSSCTITVVYGSALRVSLESLLLLLFFLR